MIDFELFSRIKNYHEQKGLSANQIAEELGLDPRTVSKWLKENRFRQRAPVCRPSKLDPFKGSIVRMLETHPYSAAQILQKICEEGFDGRYTIVKDYVSRVRPRRSHAFLKLSFAPGECAQADWGSNLPYCRLTCREKDFRHPTSVQRSDIGYQRTEKPDFTGLCLSPRSSRTDDSRSLNLNSRVKIIWRYARGCFLGIRSGKFGCGFVYVAG